MQTIAICTENKSMNSEIRHSGIVESIEGSHVRVRILQTSACAACKVAGHCNASEAKEKLVDVYGADGRLFRKGQAVVVTASRRVASKALLLGFGLPFLLLIAVLVLVLRLTGHEGVAALSALGALVPYYLLLWLCREKVSQGVQFQIE